MRTQTLTRSAGFVFALGLIASMSMFFTQAVHAEDPIAGDAMVVAPKGAIHVMASGAAEDMAQACLARIPQIASLGQRLLAEQSCAGKDRVRQAIQSAPKF